MLAFFQPLIDTRFAEQVLAGSLDSVLYYICAYTAQQIIHDSLIFDKSIGTVPHYLIAENNELQIFYSIIYNDVTDIIW